MFDKFGEFDSAEELNKAAKGLKDEGDFDSLYALAEENGIDKEDVEDYVAGDVEELATPAMAAMGRMEVERREIMKGNDDNKKIIRMTIWQFVSGMAAEPDMQTAIMKKGKRIEGIYKALEDGARKHKSGNCGVSHGTDRELQEIIRAYYVDGKTEKKIEELYQRNKKMLEV